MLLKLCVYFEVKIIQSMDNMIGIVSSIYIVMCIECIFRWIDSILLMAIILSEKTRSFNDKNFHLIY